VLLMLTCCSSPPIGGEVDRRLASQSPPVIGTPTSQSTSSRLHPPLFTSLCCYTCSYKLRQDSVPLFYNLGYFLICLLTTVFPPPPLRLHTNVCNGQRFYRCLAFARLVSCVTAFRRPVHHPVTALTPP